MTIVVMFGKTNLLGLKENRCFAGEINKGDQFWVIEDKEYSVADPAPYGFPAVSEDTPLAVILHNGSGNFHAKQLQWLGNCLLKFKPYKAGRFSHTENDPLFIKIKAWATLASEVPVNVVSQTVNEFSSVVNLGLLDELAAWNLLVLVSTSSTYDASVIDKYKKERRRVRNLVSTFAEDLNLNSTEYDKWLPLLQDRSTKYC
jgi:hypothetical protein